MYAYLYACMNVNASATIGCVITVDMNPLSYVDVARVKRIFHVRVYPHTGFGELATLTNVKRAASVICAPHNLATMNVLVVPKPPFIECIEARKQTGVEGGSHMFCMTLGCMNGCVYTYIYTYIYICIYIYIHSFELRAVCVLIWARMPWIYWLALSPACVQVRSYC